MRCASCRPHRSSLVGFLLGGFFAACAVLTSALFATHFSQQASPVVIAAHFALPIVALALSNWALSVYLLAATVPYEATIASGSVASGFKALGILVFCALVLQIMHYFQLRVNLGRTFHHQGIQYRIASLRLNPQEHPVTEDDRAGLLYRRMKTIWWYSRISGKKQTALSVWFVAAGLLPDTVAKPVIAWELASKSRTKAVRWVRTSAASHVAMQFGA